MHTSPAERIFGTSINRSPPCGKRVSPQRIGFIHLAFVAGDEAAVDALTERLRAEGHPPIDGPRRTGDGYYEAVVLDPDGNRVEVTATRLGS